MSSEIFRREQLVGSVGDALARSSMTFVNPYTYLMLRRERMGLSGFDAIGADGFLAVFLIRWLCGVPGFSRLSFDYTSLADPVFGEANARAWKVFIVGSSPSINTEFVSYLSTRYPSAHFDGSHGYFADEEQQDATVRRILDGGFQIVIVGMGAIRQERFSLRLVDGGYAGKVYTCGGFIEQTVHSGGDYYPPVIDKLNLRFLYRMYREPHTVRRYLLQYPAAMVLMAVDLLRGRLRPPGTGSTSL